jgi:hypothetical protein
MSKTLLLFINKDQPAGKIMSAIGHMMIGLGPRIPQGSMPAIRVFACSTAHLRLQGVTKQFSLWADTLNP